MDNEELFHGYLVGKLSEDQAGEFLRRLQENPGFGRSLVHYVIETHLMIKTVQV